MKATIRLISHTRLETLQICIGYCIGKTKHEPNQPIFGVQELEKIVESFRSQATRMVELERLCSTQLQKAPRENAAPAFQNFSSMGCTVSCFLVSVIISIGFL